MINFLKTSFSIFLGLAVVLAVALPATTVSAGDVDDPNDTHALGSYDQFACNGAEEDELDTGDPANSFFPPWDMSFSDKSNNGGGSFTGGFKFPFSDDEVFQSFNRESAASTEPTVVITIAPSEVMEGENVSIVAGLADFADTGLSDNRSFGITYAVNEVPLNGIQAGGQTLPDSASGVCGIATRTPDTDVDGDGMDDSWESVHGLDPSNPGDAFQDPDNDSASEFFTNALGEPLRISPETTGGSTGQMTNLAEYIWDTDPQRADTDKDGILDGEEIIGFGGPTVSFNNVETVGSEMTIRAYGVGLSHQRDAGRELENIVKLDSTTRTVFVSSGEHLRGKLEVKEKFTLPGDVMLLEANFVGTESEPESFNYTYIVDGKEVQNPQPGKSVYELEIPEDVVAGSIIPVEIQASNPATGQLAILKHDVIIGEEIILEPSEEELTAEMPFTVSANLVSGNDPEDFLFEWRLNGRLDEQASGIGKDTIALVAPSSTGGTIELNLELYERRNSQQVGKASTELEVQAPTVELSFVPSKPVEGDSVSAIAAAKGFPLNFDSDQDGEFDATLLKFEWNVDGDDLEPDENAAQISTVTFAADKAGTSHQVNVEVSSNGVGARSAGTSDSFTTGEPPQTSFLNDLGESDSLLASAINTMPNHIIIVGLTVVGLTSVLGSVSLVRKLRRNKRRGL